MKDFRNLKVWEKSHLLTLDMYKVTIGFPKEEQYGLSAQIRRSCSSIPMNISEGCGRGSNAEFGRFLQIAMGSACELEYQILLSHDLGFIKDPEYQAINGQVIQVKQMLASLISKVKSES